MPEAVPEAESEVSLRQCLRPSLGVSLEARLVINLEVSLEARLVINLNINLSPEPCPHRGD